MNMKTHVSRSALSLVLLWSTCSHAAEVAQPAKNNGPTVTIELTPQEALPAEPVFLTATFHNPGDAAIAWVNPLHSYRGGTVGIGYRRTGTEKFEPIYSHAGINFAAQGREPWHLQPKESASLVADLSYVTTPLMDVGQYIFRVSYAGGARDPRTQQFINRLGLKVWEGNIVSNEVTLKILQPEGKEAEVYKLLNLDSLRTQPEGPWVPFGSEAAETVLTQYPQSRYAKYCLYYRGIRYLARESDKGIAYLNRFIEAYPQHPLADNAAYAIVRALDRARRPQELEKELEKFYKNYPQSDMRPQADALKDVLERKKAKTQKVQ